MNLQPPIPGYERFIGAYLFHSEKKCLVDVGPRAAIPGLLSALAELKVSPDEIDYIILTHIHLDHAGGIGTAVKQCNNARIIAHPSARPHLIDPSRLWKASQKTLGELASKYGEIEPVPEDRLITATDQMKLDLGRGLVLEIYLTPGHAPHHLSLYDRTNEVLIAGETAGVCINGAIRPATPPPFRLDEFLSSVDKLIALRPKRLCYGHFGCYENGTQRLQLIREKLLAWHEIVSPLARAGKNPEEILMILREKDRSLDYLDGLSRDEYQREHQFILNAIKGLSGSARQ